MNRLSIKQRAQILHLLVEGNSLRATARISGVSRNTVDKLLRDVGAACLDYQDQTLKNLPCKRIQCDEIWSFVYSKQKNVPEGMEDKAGDIWTWTAICSDSKVVPCWHVGSRDAEAANEFMTDLASRLANRVQLTTDGHKAYLDAVEGAFEQDIDYAMLIKLYGNQDRSNLTQTRYSPSTFSGTKKVKITGSPIKSEVSTSFVERQNLTMRMSMRRFTRLTNGFSKKVENHMHAISLHYMYYNFGRNHQTLKKRTPAMKAGVSDHKWTLEEIAALADKKPTSN
jgi:IS1 family transposase